MTLVTTKKLRSAAAFVVLSLLPAAALAVGEQNGRIKGVVTEADTGLPVPGAVVTATGSKLIGGPQTVITDDNGNYLLSELPPGTYDIEVAYAGVKPIKRKAAVRLGETLPLDIAWSAELSEAEVTVVEEQRRLTRPDSTATGTVLSFDTQKNLATQRKFEDVAQQVAGVKSDRGLPAVKGATRTQNRYLIDGMDITDSVTNNFATQLNFDSIGSLEVLTGGMEAQYNAMGGVINVITNGGSDEFKLDTSLYINNQRLTAGRRYGSELYNRELIFNEDPLGPNQSYNATVNVSGPIVKQKLWYGVSFEYGNVQSSLQPAPPINLQTPPRIEHQFRPRLKLVYAPTSAHRITLSASGDPSMVLNRTPSNSALGVTQNAQNQGGFFTVMQWDYFRSQYLSTQVQAGLNFNHLHQRPMCSYFGGAFVDFGPRDPRFSEANYVCDRDRPQRRNSVDGTQWYQGGQNNDDQRWTMQFDPSVSVRGNKLGEHDAKFGIQARMVMKRFSQSTPGGSQFVDSGGGLLEAGLCDPTTGINCNGSRRTDIPPFSNNQLGFGIGFFAQDRWKIHKRFTLLPGIRFDFGRTFNSGNQVVTSSFGIGPRLGAAFDITGDQKTILSAFYGRSNDTLNLLPAAFADPRNQTSSVYNWDPAANDYAFAFSRGGSDGYRLNPTSTTPHTDEIMVGINREFFKDSVASVQYSYKKISNMWTEMEINQIWDPSGQRVVGYVNGEPRTILLYTTPDQAQRTYHGVDFIAESRPTPNWDLYASYTLSWLFGTPGDINNTVGGGNAFINPRQAQYYQGYLGDDSRHQVKLRASYNIHGFSVGGTFSFASGQPLTKLFWNANARSYSNRRTPSGTEPGSQTNNVDSITAFRTPDQLMVNMRVSYDFHELINQHLILIADVFNLLNLDTPNGVETQDLPTFGAASVGRINPLRVQLAVRYTY